ncbi:hypothetical protein M9458_040073, partial [Cirrhinus mrigala]
LLAVEEQLEQDVPQPQDVHTPVSLIEEDTHEFPVSEVLTTAEEQLEKDVNIPVSSSEDDQEEELET